MSKHFTEEEVKRMVFYGQPVSKDEKCDEDGSLDLAIMCAFHALSPMFDSKSVSRVFWKRITAIANGEHLIKLSQE